MHKKILTITLNPSVDKFISVVELKLGKSQDARGLQVYSGGKGVNVSRALKVLGIDSIPIGFAGGAQGQNLLRDLIVEQFAPNFVIIDGETRTNLTLRDLKGDRVTRVLEPGPTISSKDFASFEHKVSRLIPAFDWVVISGRRILGVPADYYQTLIQRAQKAGAKVAFDASGPDLVSGLKAKPYFLKLNRAEAEAILKTKMTDQAGYKKALRAFCRKGVRRVVITLGSLGAVGSDGQKFFYAAAPKVKAINTVGCGDAFLAGFLAACVHKDSGLTLDFPAGLHFRDALAFGVAAGTASTLSLKPGSFDRAQFGEFLQKIFPREI